MQYLSPVGGGPSVNTWPRCASQRAQSTSVRRVNMLQSSLVVMFSFATGLVKLGQPVPDSNLSSELKRSRSQHTHLYVPFWWLSQYALSNGRSVPFFLVTLNCSGLRSFFHSSSDFITLSVMTYPFCFTEYTLI